MQCSVILCLLFSDVEPAAAIQQVLSGDNLMEKDRKLSELILQLQMAREQLLLQQQQQQQQIQQQQQEANKVGPLIHILSCDNNMYI